MIEQLILQDHSPRQLVVVSSDHRLQRAARRRRAQSIDSERWYAEVVQRRVGRQQGEAAEPAKPAGPLSAAQVAHWLGRFGMSPADETVPEQANSDHADATDADADSRDADIGDKKPPARGNLANPFPPGYGEDLLEDL